MNNITIFILKALRKGYQKMMYPTHVPYDRGITDPDEASKVIYDLLASGKPCMIARYGAYELSTLVNYLGVTSSKHSVWQFIKGKQPEWWWNKNLMLRMQSNAGFFPSTEENLMKFGELMVEDSKQVDVLGSWLLDEQVMIDGFGLKFDKIYLKYLEPFWCTTPWSQYLTNKRIVVVHPFAESIINQYENNRGNLFDNPLILPLFKSLRIVKAVQSIGGENDVFTDWFDALSFMEREIAKEDYDVCLIGCGAYGFPLAAYVKRQGKQAIHLGGALQLLFGIMGKRWETIPEYKTLINGKWVRPQKSEAPKSKDCVENGCYW